MWIVLFVVAEVVATVWLAALLLAARDRLCDKQPPRVEETAFKQPTVEAVPLPGWKRVLVIPLALLVGPPVVIVVLTLIAPLLLVQFGFLAYHWLRCKLFGIPIPRLELPEDA